MNARAGADKQTYDDSNTSAPGDQPNSLQPNPTSDPYLLRGLLWCGFCNVDLVTALVSDGSRAYGCRNLHCSRSMEPAEPLEQLVWYRFSALNEAAARAVQPDRRQAALREVLKRVTVHGEMIDLWFEWRD